MEEILTQQSGKKILLLGNEAIVRGALEQGVQFVSTYPGTPASEIGNTFYFIGKKAGVYFEFSTNEKVALEAAVGASFSGLKTLVAMKNFGMNVALDALLPFVYTGTKGPTVIVVADDPSCHSSAQSEENSRGIAALSHIPILEPASPQECKDFVKLGFQISAKYKLPVIVRTTTRIAHQRAPVLTSAFKPRTSLAKGKFVRNSKQFVTLPPRVLGMKEELLANLKKIQKLESAKLSLVESAKPGLAGIITSGIAYLYVKEALEELNLNIPVLKLGFFHPLPEKQIKDFIQPLKKVLVVEELEPHLEKEVQRLAKEVNCSLRVVGKELLPEVGELKPDVVTLAVAKFSGKKYSRPKLKDFPLSKRFPLLCPGCPYWLVVNAVKKAVDQKEVIFGGDIGCYMLFGMPSVNLQDYLSCMGSSLGIAHGIKKATDQKLITFIGDSTFFHAGIPALINTVFNQSNPLIIILENETTAMTGFQPHPGARGVANELSIEKIVKACGVKHVKAIDPINQKLFIQTVKDYLKKKEVAVIIAQRPCVRLKSR